MAGFGVYGGGGTTGAATEATLLDVENELVTLNATAATLATEATAGNIEAELITLNAKDFSTQTTLAAVDTKLAAMQVTLTAMESDLDDINSGTPNALGQSNMAGSQSVVIASNQSDVPISAAALPLPTGAATEATLGSCDIHLTTLASVGFATEVTLAACSADLSSIAGKDFATQSTLQNISTIQLPAGLGQTTMANSLPVTLASNQSALPLPTGAATEATLASVLAKTEATPITGAFDEIALTYVGAGNGVGEIATVVWKLATVTVKTATLSYNVDNKLTGVVWS